MRRFFVEGPMQEEMIIQGEDAHHIVRVLRFACGRELIVADNERSVAVVEIIEIGEAFVKVKRLRMLDANTEAPIEVTLAQCLPKADKMDFIVQKAVELGVSSICPVIGAHCIVKYDASKKEARQRRWQKIAEEAAKQCGRTALPEVAPILPLRDFLAAVEPDAALFLCYEGEAQLPLRDFLEASPMRRFVILIGPEGGFSPAEVVLCKSYGAATVTMGPRILRTETAAIAAVSIVMYQNGDLNGRS